MAQHLGVVFNERDQSKSATALPVPGGVMALYSVKGPTDKGYLCKTEDDIRRLFGQPQAEMRDGVSDAGAVFDLNRGLQNAFRFVRTGLPMYISRAIPNTLSDGYTPSGGAATGKAYAAFQFDSASYVDDANSILAIAKGHGEIYNGYSIFVKGVESVQRIVKLTGTTKISLRDCVLPGTLVISDPANEAGDTSNDVAAPFGMTPATAATMSRSLTLANSAFVLKYEDDITAVPYSAGPPVVDAVPRHYATSIVGVNGTDVAPIKLSYERTTTERLVRVFICNDGETDPANNNYENYLVSLKDSGKDEAGNACFIEDVINPVSELVQIIVGTSYDQTKLPLSMTATAAAAVAPLASGQNGTYARTDAEIKTALQFYRDRTKYDYLYCFDAGYANDVKKELCDIAAIAARPFAVAYIDPDFGTCMDSLNKVKTGTALGTESQYVDKICNWRMAMGNREFGILTGPCWGLISDEFNGGRKLWMPPSWDVCSNAIIVDNTLGSWNSVGGPRRGVLSFEKIAINLYAYVDQLNAKQVNPIVIDERGIMMYYGNKTLKLVASAMQQAHARKTRGRMSREFYFTALDYVMENLVGSTFNSIRDDFEDIIATYGEALESYSLVVAPNSTLADDLNKQILRIQVGLIFNQIAEEINITTTVYRNGTDLSVVVA